MTNSTANVFIDITAHGFGHLSQTAPILNSLRGEYPNLRYIVRSGLPENLIRSRLGADVQVIYSDTDFGCEMQSPFEVDREATLRRYISVDAGMDKTVDQISRLIREHDCRGVLTNISYPALVAAAREGVPSVACSSLIWSEVADHYIGAAGEEAQRVLSNIRAAYDSATLILRLDPGMPMARHKTVSIERPIARVGRHRPRELRTLLGLDEEIPLVLCAFGGMLPQCPGLLRASNGLALLGPSAWAPNVIVADGLGWVFEDLIASVDAVLTKPGYGIVAELGCNRTPGIFVSRGDWPEEPHLLAWLKNICNCELISTTTDFTADSLGTLARRLRNIPKQTPIKPDGHRIAAAHAAKLFSI